MNFRIKEIKTVEKFNDISTIVAESLEDVPTVVQITVTNDYLDDIAYIKEEMMWEYLWLKNNKCTFTRLEEGIVI